MPDEPLSFLARLKQHHVYRVAVGYGAAIAVLIQVVARAFPYFGWATAVPAVIIILAASLPLVMVLAWLLIEPKGKAQPETWQRRHWKLSAVVTAIVIALVVISGFYALQFSQRHAEHLMTHAAASATTTAIPAKSIAILPFANDSNDPNQRYFSDGLSESLIIALSQYPTLTVIGRESSFQFRNTTLDSEQIGKKLGVATLLEGSVSHAGNEVRVRAELVSAANGRTLWSDQYDRPYKNLFALQDDLTKAVATALKAKLLGSKKPGAVVQTDRPPSGSLAAYSAFLEGRFYTSQLNESRYRKAIAAYQRAIAADPKYAAAYAELSYAWTTLSINFLSGSALAQAQAKARAAADTALRLDPDSAVAFTARGWLLLATLDWQGAEAAFRRALTLDPAYLGAMTLWPISLAAVGRLDEAIRLGRKAIVANPLDAGAYGDLAGYLMGAGELEAATQTIDRAIALAPKVSLYHAWAAEIYVLRGHFKAALTAAQAEPSPAWRVWALALTYQAEGDKAQADRALQTLITNYGNGFAVLIAEVYAYRGNSNQAFAWLNRAWRQHDPRILRLYQSPFLLRYKNDPRFAAFCRKVGLPTPSEIKQATSPATPVHEP